MANTAGNKQHIRPHHKGGGAERRTFFMKSKLPWVSVRKELPEIGKECLVYSEDFGIKIASMDPIPDILDSGTEWIVRDEGSAAKNVTHWLPLEPPDQE